MKVNIRYIALFLVSFCLVGVGGFIIGSHLAQDKLNKYFTKLNYTANATEIISDVKLLKLIRSGKVDEAVELLETLLDVNLSGLALYDKIAPNERDKEIIDAIITAKRYRVAYSLHKVNQKLDDSVNKTFGLVNIDN